MARKSKLYIPLRGNKGVTLIKVSNIKEIQEIMPSEEDIKENLLIQFKRSERNEEYKPLQRRVTKEQFQKIEREIRKKKAGHQFNIKAIDIIGLADANLRLVQIIQVEQ